MITIATPKALLDEAGSDINKCLSLIYMMMEYYDGDDKSLNTRLAIIADMQESMNTKLLECKAYLDELERTDLVNERSRANLQRLQKVA